MRIALLGYGRMGKAIEAVAIKRNHQIVLKTGSQNHFDLTADNLSQTDVAIEFTGASGALENLLICAKAKIPVVCGSTGWLHNFDKAVGAFEENNTAFVYASNYSIGVNIFFELNKKLAALMSAHPEYRPGLRETHHTGKKDAPSGTAITLAEQILNENPSFKSWANADSGKADELSIISERVDPAPGTHEIIYKSTVDDIQIIHTAHNREGFAVGAVLAAEFLLGKKGIYSMKDVLGF